MKELTEATEDFSTILGEGGFGAVYKGTLRSGELVAVKRHGTKAQGYDDASFRNEVKLLSFVHHRNLVKLQGYCLHREKLLLVYELVSRGSLQDHSGRGP